MSATTQKLAVKLRDQAARQADRKQRVQRAEVTSTSPLTIEIENDPHAVPLQIDDDFDLSFNARLYAENYGFVTGDTVLLHREAGEYIVFDVMTDTASVNIATQGDLDAALIGGGDKAITFEFNSKLATWTCAHGFGRPPAGIRAFDKGAGPGGRGVEMLDPVIVHNADFTSTTLTWTNPEWGFVDFS